MQSHSIRSAEIDRLWDRLRTDTKQFLKERDPLEDLFVECKHSILTEPLYDRIKLEENIRTSQSAGNISGWHKSSRVFHENKFRALVAIAAMANSGGGIVLFGVASAEDPIPQPTTPLAEKGMNGKQLEAKFKAIQDGIRCGVALVSGIDHEMPLPKRKQAFDAKKDLYFQNLFGKSGFFTTNGYKKEGTDYGQKLYEFSLEGATGPESYPTVTMHASDCVKWHGLGPHLITITKFLTVEDDSDSRQKRTILALRIGSCNQPIYYKKIPSKGLVPDKIWFPVRHVASSPSLDDYSEETLLFFFNLFSGKLVHENGRLSPSPTDSSAGHCSTPFNLAGLNFRYSDGFTSNNQDVSRGWCYLSEALDCQMFFSLLKKSGRVVGQEFLREELESNKRVKKSEHAWKKYAEVVKDLLVKHLPQSLDAFKNAPDCIHCSTIVACRKRVILACDRLQMKLEWDFSGKEGIRAILSGTMP